MKPRAILSTIILFLIFGVNMSFALDQIYIVKKSETLTSILYKKNLMPIYGKNGSLKKALELNPKIKKYGRGNKIFPKMKIVLPIQEALQDELVQVELAPIIERKPSNDFEQSFYWTIAPQLSWKNLSSTDENVFRASKINALSKMNYGLALTYGMHFEEKTDVYSKLALESVNFTQDSSVNLAKEDFIATGFNIGILYEEKWTLEVGMNDEFFLTSPGVSRVEIKKVALPEIRSGYQKDFYNYKNANLSYLLSATAILPRSTPGVDSDLSFGTGASIEAKLKNQSFVIGYEIKFLKASGNSTDNHNIFWNYIWKTL